MIPNEAYLDSVAAALDLPIDDEDRAEVLNNLQLIFRQSAGLMALSLDVADESASLFVP